MRVGYNKTKILLAVYYLSSEDPLNMARAKDVAKETGLNHINGFLYELKRAGLVKPVAYGCYRITEEGLRILRDANLL